MPGSDPGVTPDVDRLLAENERIFHEAQHAADTVFANYQLSQILASHDAIGPLAGAILDELTHLCGADAGAIWIADPRAGRDVLAAQRGDATIPARGDDAATRFNLDDGSRRVGVLAMARSGGQALEADGVQFLSHVRHELAVALRGAQLREALELERAELSAVFEGASDAIVLVDDRQRVVRVNAAAQALLAVGASEIAGRECAEVLACHAGGVDACRGGCPFAHVIATGEPIGGHERTLGPGIPDPVHVVGSYALASRSAGGSAMAVAVFRDTTQVAHLQELRRGFIATVSHELRTPLALIKGYVDTLLDLDLDPRVMREYLERIDQTTERLTQLVRQTLDVTQLAVGQLILERSPIPVADLLAAASDDLRVQHPQLVAEVACQDPMPAVDVDAARIRQVLDNLLDNAVKYGPPDGPIRISATSADGWVSVEVEDRGVGVPAEERELVFEQFHRGGNVRESTLSGYGLGLSISRRIVESHGGQLFLAPANGRGTRVVMRLPAARQPVPVGGAS